MRRRHLSLIALLILALLVGGLGWTIYAPIRQERLNRALIAAIKQNDTTKALDLLNAVPIPMQEMILPNISPSGG